MCLIIKPQSSSHYILQYQKYAAQCGPPEVGYSPYIWCMMGLTGRQDKA